MMVQKTSTDSHANIGYRRGQITPSKLVAIIAGRVVLIFPIDILLSLSLTVCLMRASRPPLFLSLTNLSEVDTHH